MYQVFAYSKDEYDTVKKNFPPNERHGYDMNSDFPRYAQPKTEYSRSGHSKYYGTVKMASNHLKFASDILPHLKDQDYGLESSIFMIPMAAAGVLGPLNKIDSEIIVGMNFKTLGSYITSKELSNKWTDLVRSILFAKYGIMMNPNLRLQKLPFDYATAYAHFTPLYPTTMPTYFLGQKSLYMDLRSVEQIIGPKYVKTTLIFADTIEVASDVSIPGNERVIILCNNFLSKSVGNFVPEVRLGVDPKDSEHFKIYAGNFLGTLQVQSSDPLSHFTIFNGHRLLLEDSKGKKEVHFDPYFFQKFPDVNNAPFLYGDPGKDNRLQVMKDSFEDGLSLFAVSLENILNYNMGEETPHAAYQFCNWIVNTLKSSGSASVSRLGLDNTIGNVYVRALTLQKTRNPDQGDNDPPVPYLSYFMYKEAIEAPCDVAEEYGRKMNHIEELIFQQIKFEKMEANQKTMNNNIKNVAKFLLEQNKAMGENQDDFVKYYDQLIKKKMASLKIANQLKEKYSRELDAELVKVDSTGRKLKTAMENDLAFQIFKAIVDAVTGLFTGKMSSMPSQLAGMIEALIKVKNALKAMAAFARLMEAIEDGDLAKAGEALNKIDSDKAKAAFLTELDWKKFDFQVEEVLTGVQLPEARKFDHEAHLYTAIGRQFVVVAKKICLLQYDIAVYVMKRAIYARQKKRRNDLGKIMDQKDIATDEAMNLDLFSLGTSLRAGQATVLMELLTVMLEQNGALRYHSLQIPTVPTGYDILSVKTAMASNVLSALEYYNSYNPPPHEMEELKKVVIPNVPYKDLVGAGYNFDLPNKEDSFYPFSRIRITEVQAYISDVETNTAKLYTIVSGGGGVLEDRDLDRKMVEFTTIPHIYPFAFYTNDMTVAEGNRLVDSDLTTYSLLTPFTSWNIHLPPNVKENSGMMNKKEDVTVTLKFRIFAIRKDPLTPR